MRINETTWTRLNAIGLGIAIILATFLIVNINPLEISIIYLALLAGVMLVGVISNIWGGLAASAIAVFAIILINQYAGIYPREGRIMNVATELMSLLLVGPLSGALAGAIERMQRQVEQWLERVEKLASHDETLGTLKPQWGIIRLDEEIIRARRFSRPLSVALLQFEPNPGVMTAKPAALRAERLAVLQGLIRMARAVSQSPVVVAHAGGDQILIIFPEHTREQVQQVVAGLQTRAGTERYFPLAPRSKSLKDNSLGKLFSQWGSMHCGIATLNEDLDNGDTLIAKARASL